MTDSRQIEQQAADWLVRRDTGDWTPLDQQVLEAWLSASARHKVAFLRLDRAAGPEGAPSLALKLRRQKLKPRFEIGLRRTHRRRCAIFGDPIRAFRVRRGSGRGLSHAGFPDSRWAS